MSIEALLSSSPVIASGVSGIAVEGRVESLQRVSELLVLVEVLCACECVVEGGRGRGSQGRRDASAGGVGAT